MGANQSNAMWAKLFRPVTLMLPFAYTLFVGGIAGYFGVLEPITLALMLISAICVQITSNIACEFGKLDLEQARKGDFYREKFAQLKRVGKRVDPAAGTAGTLEIEQLKGVIVTSFLLSLVIGYFTILFALENMSIIVKAYAFVAYLLFLVLLVLRYVGSWHYGMRVYGDLILFVLMGIIAAFGGFMLFSHTFVFGALYPSAGFGALAVAISNMHEISTMDRDLKLETSTFAITFGADNTAKLHMVLVIISLIWFAMFIPLMGGGLTWKLAFLIFFFPLIRDAIAFKKNGTPENIADFKKSLYLSVLFLSIAFFVCAGSNSLGLAFLMLHT